MNPDLKSALINIGSGLVVAVILFTLGWTQNRYRRWLLVRAVDRQILAASLVNKPHQQLLFAHTVTHMMVMTACALIFCVAAYLLAHKIVGQFMLFFLAVPMVWRAVAMHSVFIDVIGKQRALDDRTAENKKDPEAK